VADPFAPPLLDDVLDARKAITGAQADVVDARRQLWLASIACGLLRPAQQFSDRAVAPEVLLGAVEGRSDAAAEQLREAYEQLRAAEGAASCANDRNAAALGRLRLALPPSERRSELSERLLGHPGRQFHRVYALEDPRGRVRVAPRAVCSRRRTPMWRTPAGRPVDIQLCDACREGRQAFRGESDEVRTGLPTPSPARRVATEAQTLAVRLAWRGLPFAAVAAVILVAGTAFDLGPLANNPLGQFVVGQFGRVIGTL
jgi:hypothetical protein